MGTKLESVAQSDNAGVYTPAGDTYRAKPMSEEMLGPQ